MAFSFIDSAKKSVSGSDVTAQGKPVNGQALASIYGDNGFYLRDFDMITMTDRQTGENRPVAVFSVSDTPDGEIKYNTKGRLLTNRMIREWVDAFNGDINAARDAYKASGTPVRMKIEYTSSNNGNPLQKVTIMSD